MTFFDSLFGCFHDWYEYTSKEMDYYKVHICLKCGVIRDWAGVHEQRQNAREAKAKEMMAGRERFYKKRSVG